VSQGQLAGAMKTAFAEWEMRSGHDWRIDVSLEPLAKKGIEKRLNSFVY
jgi:hypothetical protein